jgi:hypothetical protein
MLNNTHVPNEIPTICPAVNFSTFLGLEPGETDPPDKEGVTGDTGDTEPTDTEGVTGDTGDEVVARGFKGDPGDDNKLEGLVKILGLETVTLLGVLDLRDLLDLLNLLDLRTLGVNLDSFFAVALTSDTVFGVILGVEGGVTTVIALINLLKTV